MNFGKIATKIASEDDNQYFIKGSLSFEVHFSGDVDKNALQEKLKFEIEAAVESALNITKNEYGLDRHYASADNLELKITFKPGIIPYGYGY